MLNHKELCLSLAQCDSEEKVIKILQEYNLWDDDKYRRSYGDSENNYGTIGNQQSLPETALVEKIINSVDAVLMSKCYAKGVDPTSGDAPQSIEKALYEYYDIFNGKLHNISPTDRRKLADNIMLIATGAKRSPSYTIIDRGEGQTPHKMPETLLSLGKSNKLKIPFVQGKFNMGGTGVLRFCGESNVQLIISKRNPCCPVDEGDKTKEFWGYTVIRRFNPEGRSRNSVYKYLTFNSEIPYFQSDGLDLLPGKYPKIYTEKLEYGTYIKLFDYQMSGGLNTLINFDLYYRLSLLMPNIALPVRMLERRKYKANSYETTLSGLMVRLEEDKRENLEEEFRDFPSASINISGNALKASLYVFKKGKHKNYLKNEGVLFTINGQTHGSLNKQFFSRKAVGMSYLADSILIIVDCSETSGRFREDLFMSSRDRLVDGKLKFTIEGELQEWVKSHPGLKKLRMRRREEAIADKLGDNKPLVEVMNKIFKNHPTLSKIFVEGVQLPNPFAIKKTSVVEKHYEGKEFPTFFKLTRNYNKKKPKLYPINNRRLRVEYKTDVTDDYFSRDNEPGEFKLYVNGQEDKGSYKVNLWKGSAYLNVKLGRVKVGDIIHCKTIVSDVQTTNPFTEDFYIKITDERGIVDTANGKRKNPSNDNSGDDNTNISGLDIPMPIEVRKEEWDEHEFDQESALKVIDTGESGYDFYINMDNIYLLTELKSSKDDEIKILESRYKYGLVLLGMALLHNKKKLGKEGENEAINIEEKIYGITSAITPILLPMISDLGDLQIGE